MFESIRRTFWDALVRHAATRNLGVDDIGRGLGTDRGTYNKWYRVPPEAMVFQAAVVLVLRETLSRMPVPEHKDVVLAVVEHTLRGIGREELSREAGAFDRERWRCVHRFLHHPGSFTPETKVKLSDDAADRVLRDVVRWNIDTGHAAAVRTPATLAAAVFDWCQPYALFRLGLLRGWERLDDAQLG